MSNKDEGQTLLENAYKLSTPEDSIAFYNVFASTYDADFADKLGFYYPTAIAKVFYQYSDSSDFPVADIGCGTGLAAEALDLPPSNIDGMDISSAMLALSKQKGFYRALYEVDLTQSLGAIKHDYGAVISVGTFTSGHLGPQPLKALLDIARSNALFVIGVKKEFFEEAGFDSVLQSMVTEGLISDIKVIEVPVYAGIEHEHADDKAFVLVYRKR